MVSIPEPASTDLSLRGRLALVTGSTGGIGYAIARRLAAAGCDIALHGLATPEEAAPAVAALAEAGARVQYCRADLADPTAIATLVEATDGIDILVNNAATRHFGAIEATDPAAWDMDLAVNLSAAFHIIRLALPGMRRRGFGRIVNMSSIYGLVGTRDRIGYVTTKTALIGLTRAVALETAESGITCNAVCPGSTMTPNIETRIRSIMDEAGIGAQAAAARFLAGKQPTGRFVDAEAIAAMVGFLCSPAARDITGAALPMDGGWSAG